MQPGGLLGTEYGLISLLRFMGQTFPNSIGKQSVLSMGQIIGLQHVISSNVTFSANITELVRADTSIPNGWGKWQ